ncbi:hypothetical protein BDFG_00672 [Blastomyces dermatitidis ATCC 26199]|nr:hypothetical protein BDFG_00672 [Blastomyces dermatitidis ATCC 26199]
MNSLFNAALKQSSALRRDLEAFAEAPTTTSPAVQGQISASLTSFSRTIDDYSSLSKQELIPAKQELAFERLKNFRTELADYRQLFDRLRKEREDAQSISNRNELLGRRPHHAATPENPYAQSNLPQSSPFSNPNYPHHRSSPSTSGFGGGPTNYAREDQVLREQSFFSNTNIQLDEFLDRGRAVLGDLGQQREILKGTQRRLYSVGNTLGYAQRRRTQMNPHISSILTMYLFEFSLAIPGDLDERNSEYSLRSILEDAFPSPLYSTLPSKPPEMTTATGPPFPANTARKKEENNKKTHFKSFPPSPSSIKSIKIRNIHQTSNNARRNPTTLALLTLSASVIADSSDSSCYFCYKGSPSNGKGQFPTWIQVLPYRQ